jgi:hypothetical protein
MKNYGEFVSDTPSDILAQRMVSGGGLVGIWYLVKSRASELDVLMPVSANLKPRLGRCCLSCSTAGLGR